MAVTRPRAVTPPPAPWPRIIAPRASSTGSTYARARPCGVSISLLTTPLIVPARSVRQQRHRQPLVAAEQHRARDGARAEALAHLVERDVERAAVAAVERQGELDRAVVLEVRDG